MTEQPNAKRQREFKKRQEERGLVRAYVWVPKEDKKTIEALARKLRKDRGKV